MDLRFKLFITIASLSFFQIMKNVSHHEYAFNHSTHFLLTYFASHFRYTVCQTQEVIFLKQIIQKMPMSQCHISSYCSLSSSFHPLFIDRREKSRFFSKKLIWYDFAFNILYDFFTRITVVLLYYAAVMPSTLIAKSFYEFDLLESSRIRSIELGQEKSEKYYQKEIQVLKNIGAKKKKFNSIKIFCLVDDVHHEHVCCSLGVFF